MYCLHTPNFKCSDADMGEKKKKKVECYCLPQIHKLRLVYSIGDRDSKGVS